MELNIHPNKKTFMNGLGLSSERIEVLLKSAKTWLEDSLRKDSENGTQTMDKLDFIKQCADISADLQEYTFLLINLDPLISNAQQEIHAETCPRCRLRKEAEEEDTQRRRFREIFRPSLGSDFGAGGTVLVISL